MKILFLQKRLLFPPDMGGKIRTLNVLKYLARWHDVTYLCNVQAGEEEALEQMRELGVRLETISWRETPRNSVRFYGELAANLFSRYPYNVNKDFDPRLRQRAAELLTVEEFDLLICDFVQMARNVEGMITPPRILFEHNVEAQIFQRHAQQDEGWLRRKYMGLQWRKMRRFEAAAGRNFDAAVAVSRQDADHFESEYGWRHVQVIDTAVDVEYFQPRSGIPRPDRVVFVGSLDWLPNQDGVRYFVKRIWPDVRRQHPQAVFQIVGRNPTSSVVQLGKEPGVEVVGSVPDVRPYLSEAAVVVVPLLVGGGTRLKIYEALAMQKVVVSTPLGAEGLEVTPGQHLLLAEQPAEFAEAIHKLLTDVAFRNRLAEQAREFVVENYSAERVARQFEQVCLRTVEAAGGKPEHADRTEIPTTINAAGDST